MRHNYPKMTPQEIEEEWILRREERLAISAGANKPLPEHFAQAKKEADEWREECLKTVNSVNERQNYANGLP